ncbi:MAG: hypothetical protein M5U15_09545 [Kiritimatiellae bacterium]|nr:hypothetical protein [Kiritimatiellia bacterium]
MTSHARITKVVWALNTLGFIAYLVWLAGSHERILTEREGVIFLLPCVAFIFVFVCLRAASNRTAEDAEASKEESWNAARKH